MTREQIIAIFMQIVVDMAYRPGSQVNSFFVVDEPPTLHSDSLGATYRHFAEGLFYSRTWVNQGADPNAVKAQFPILFVEENDATVPDLEHEEIVLEFFLLILDTLGCDGCPDDIVRTPEAVKLGAFEKMRALLKELNTYGLYEVDRSGDITFEWLSAGRAVIVEAEPETTSIALIDDIITKIETAPVTIDEWGDDPNFKGYFTRLAFRICYPIDAEFEYNNPVVPALATTTCPC